MKKILTTFTILLLSVAGVLAMNGGGVVEDLVVEESVSFFGEGKEGIKAPTVSEEEYTFEERYGLTAQEVGIKAGNQKIKATTIMEEADCKKIIHIPGYQTCGYDVDGNLVFTIKDGGLLYRHTL